MSTRNEATPRETYLNNNLPVLYVDDVDTRHREDGINYLSFTTNTPAMIVEQVRLMMNDKDLHKIIDALCITTEYYPKKPKRTSKAKSSPSK